MVEALGWGALAASSLVLGTVVALVYPLPRRVVGLVLAFGAGALVSAVSYELAEEGIKIGHGWAVGLGLGLGALVYFILDGIVSRRGEGNALALGAFLDGIPEQLVLGIGLAAGQGVSVGLIVAIFVSNLPEAVGSASDMRAAGRTDAKIIRLWTAVATICMLATVAGYAIAEEVSRDANAAVNGFAAGALLVMLVDSMIPEAREQAGRAAGLLTVVGFAVAAGLSIGG